MRGIASRARPVASSTAFRINEIKWRTRKKTKKKKKKALKSTIQLVHEINWSDILSRNVSFSENGLCWPLNCKSFWLKNKNTTSTSASSKKNLSTHNRNTKVKQKRSTRMWNENRPIIGKIKTHFFSLSTSLAIRQKKLCLKTHWTDKAKLVTELKLNWKWKIVYEYERNDREFKTASDEEKPSQSDAI